MTRTTTKDRPAANGAIQDSAGRLDTPSIPQIRARIRLDLREHDEHYDGDLGRFIDSRLSGAPPGTEVVLHLRAGQHWSVLRHSGHVGSIVIECDDAPTARNWHEAMNRYGVGGLGGVSALWK